MNGIKLILAALLLALGSASAVASVDTLADELLSHWQLTRADVRFQSGLPIDTFDAVTFERAQQDARFSQDMLVRLDKIALDGLPRAQWLLARTMRHELRRTARAAENYWFDFGVTPYAGGGLFSFAQTVLAAQPLKEDADLDRYLRLLDAYATMCDQVAAKTRAQAARNIRVSQPAIAGVIDLFGQLRANATATLLPDPARLAGLTAAQVRTFDAEARKRIDTRIITAYDAIVRIFDDEYRRQAPAEVGVGRLPGGKEHYQRVIDDIGVSLTPAQIHELGQRRVAELDAQMRAVREQVGFKGKPEAFHKQLLEDPRFLARTREEMGERLLAQVKRMEPHIPAYFSSIPRARYGVKALDAALEGGQTFGFYLSPKPADPVGYYYYNGSDLKNRSLFAAAHLIFHELLPGHHLQLALQLENTATHPVRRFIGPDAFVEGWAEYAASLAKEMGLYADPYDLYGQLVMESFFAVRLVVDTGMNHFDWPLDKARAYMKAHVLNSDSEIASETLRYSTDLFGQALNYRLGYEKFWELRHRAEQALGRHFDIRAFHAAAIDQGAMPLAVLDEQIDWFIGQQAAALQAVPTGESPPTRMAHELISHSEVVIDQSAARIWPYILDPNEWKQGVRLVHVSGEIGKAGEVFAAMSRTAGDSKPAFYAQNVEVVPHRRRVIKMYDADGGALTGYASWELDEQNAGATRVSYRVYAEALLSKDKIAARSAEQLAEEQARNLEKNNARFGKELAVLKELVEGRARATNNAAGSYISSPDTIVAASGMRADVERGLFFVPENRRDPNSRVIAIHFLRFAAHRREAGRAPVFLLPGGPGSEISFKESHSYYALPMVERLRRTRDVVYVSQRGNPKAPGLVPGLWQLDTAYPLNEPASAERRKVSERASLQQALQQWASRGVDLRGYDILNIVDDVYELRAALGYDKIVLRGCSFGSQWSLSYIKRWPQTVDRALLSGVEPLDHAYDSPKCLWASLTRLAKRAEADPAFARDIPKGGLIKALQEVIQRLELQPQIVSIEDPRSSQSVAVTVGADDVRDLIASLVVFGDMPREALGNWPRFILEMYRGDFRFVAAKAWEERRAQGPGKQMIGLLIDNSLGITAKRDAQLLAEPEARWLGDINAHYRATRDLTPTANVGDAFRADWPIEVPVLLMNGDLDWSTSLENARHLRRHLRRGHLIEIEGGTHCDEGVVMAQEQPQRMEQIDAFVDADFEHTTAETFFATLPGKVTYAPVHFVALAGPSLYEQWLANARRVAF